MKTRLAFGLLIITLVVSLDYCIGESLDVLHREKRVISRIPGEDVPVDLGTLRFLINIKKNKRLHCVGSILSYRTAVTAARCVVLPPWNYEVLSGSKVASKGMLHNITHIAMHDENPSRSSTFPTGIALITVTPFFKYRTTVSNISLHTEPIFAGISGIVSSWGSYVYGGPKESSCPTRLRSINVTILNQQECRNIYRGHFPITEAEFCTYHPKRLCGYTDAGAPFVIENELVGVHIGRIDTAGRELPIKPDVFILLQHLQYRQWINRNIDP